MDERLTIRTAVYGGYDVVRPPAEQDIPARWLCFTDDRDLEVPEPWEKVVKRPTFNHPNLAAKPHKMIGPQRWLWIDANIEITSETFAREALAQVNDGVALYRHPRRDCIFMEVEASLTTESQGGRYKQLPLRNQVDSYRAEGFPAHAGLYACGVLAWDGALPRFGPAWLAECARWSYQDQLSFPVVCRRLGIEPGTFGHPQIERQRNGYLENRWLRIHSHR